MTRGKLIIGGAVLTLLLARPGVKGAGARLRRWRPSSRASTWCGSPPSSAISKGRFVQDLTARDFEVARRRPDAADHRSAARPRRHQRRGAVRRQRQHGRPHAERARSRDARAELAGRDARRGGGLHLRHAPRRAHAVHDRAAGAARVDVAASCRSARRRCTTRSPQTARRVGEREGRRRAVVVLTDGADNASQLKPAEVSAIASAIDVPVYIFGIVPSIDNPSADTSTHSVESIGVRRSAGRPGGVDRRPRRSSPARRDSAASRRGRSSTSCGISTSSRSNRAASRAGIRSWSARATRTSIVRARSGYIAGQSRPTAH